MARAEVGGWDVTTRVHVSILQKQMSDYLFAFFD